MGAPLRDIRLTRGNERQRAPNLIGLDESATTISNEEYTVVVAVRAARDDEPRMLRALIEHDLQPFRHKSASLVRYGHANREERGARVENFIRELNTLPASWAAVLYQGTNTTGELSAAAVMAAKKSITNPLSSGDLAHGCGGTALLHDGKEDEYSDYFSSLREHMPSTFDTGFQKSICPVFLTFLEDADRTYPPTNAADYIAGYIADQLEESDPLENSLLGDRVNAFDQSWVDPAPQPEQPYKLDSIEPLEGEGLRSRVLAWILGKGIPRHPSTTTDDPYRRFVEQIDDPVITEYLLSEL